MADKNKKPTIDYWHVYTDENGVSRQRRRQLTGFELESMGGGSGEQWNNNLMQGASKVIFSELPADFDGDWHENPQPQWIIPLSGGWWVETMDGQRVEMRTGELSFGADQGTNDEKGHRSGVLNNEPCRMMIVQFTENEELRGGKVAPDEL
ncbi:cupin [Lewinellaceae bacterium SD302]|nr:cupin [Lewinellaceae bacterium SD302]